MAKKTFKSMETTIKEVEEYSKGIDPAVQVIKEEFEHNWDKISDNPDVLIKETNSLTKRSVKSYWLIGQRVKKLHEWFMNGNCKETTEWKVFIKEKIGYSDTNSYDLMLFYKNIKWEELDEIRITPTKAVLISSVKDKVKRKMLFHKAHKENLTSAKLQKEVKKSKTKNNSEHLDKLLKNDNEKKYSVLNESLKNETTEEIQEFTEKQFEFDGNGNKKVVKYDENSKVIFFGKSEEFFIESLVFIEKISHKMKEAWVCYRLADKAEKIDLLFELIGLEHLPQIVIKGNFSLAGPNKTSLLASTIMNSNKSLVIHTDDTYFVSQLISFSDNPENDFIFRTMEGEKGNIMSLDEMKELLKA